ncbi:hypothetical protein D3C84_708560 [compost metagenome]
MQQVSQTMADGWLGQCVRFIKNHDCLAAEVGHFRQPVGELLQLVATMAGGSIAGRCKGLPAAAQRHRGRQPLGKTAAIVSGIQGQPCNHCPARQKLPSPLRQ